MVGELEAELVQGALEFRTVDGPGAVLVETAEYMLPILLCISFFFSHHRLDLYTPQYIAKGRRTNRAPGEKNVRDCGRQMASQKPGKARSPR